MAEEETPAVEEVVTEVVEEPTAEETPAEPEVVVEEVVVEEAPAAKSKSKKTVEEVVETQAVEEPVFNEVVAAQAEAIATIPAMMQSASGTKLALSSRIKR